MKTQEKVGGALADTNVENGPLIRSLVEATMASETYNPPSQAQTGKNDVDSEEQRAPRPHNLPRKHLNSKTSPHRKPKFDANSFEDPVCDEFWTDIWVACATHNVGVCEILPSQTYYQRPNIHIRPRSSAAFFASYQTTSSRLGSITRIGSHIMSVFSTQYASRSCPERYNF
jgi:hypothetical protein